MITNINQVKSKTAASQTTLAPHDRSMRQSYTQRDKSPAPIASQVNRSMQAKSIYALKKYITETEMRKPKSKYMISLVSSRKDGDEGQSNTVDQCDSSRKIRTIPKDLRSISSSQ